MTLLEFLRKNEKAILTSIDERSPALATARLASEQLQRGLPIFFRQLLKVPEQLSANSATPSDLFKPFEQHNKNRGGLGLGLAIAQRAVALNDGVIGVQNLPGRGCVFRISLPRIRSIAEERAAVVNG